MDISANYKSGIFLGMGILFFIFSILIVDSDGNIFESKFEAFSWIENSQGLAVGSIVSLSGLTVGNVSDLEFSPNEKKVKVTLSIKRKFQEKIPKDSIIDVRTQGALGDKYLFISPGDFSSGLIKDGDFLTATPQGGILEIIGKRGSDTERFFDLLIELQKFAKNLNNQNIPEEIRSVTAEARKTLQGIQLLTQELQQKTLAPLHQSVTKLNSVMDKVDRGQGTLGKLINDPSIFDQAKSIMGGRSSQKYFDRALSESVR